jgi:hypothetical protein
MVIPRALRGAWWGRDADKLGLAAVTNGLSADHERHLELGGKGFLLGDGTLRYGRETIVETYYTAPVYRGVSLTADGQVIVKPGYNIDGLAASRDPARDQRPPMMFARGDAIACVHTSVIAERPGIGGAALSVGKNATAANRCATGTNRRVASGSCSIARGCSGPRGM